MSAQDFHSLVGLAIWVGCMPVFAGVFKAFGFEIHGGNKPHHHWSNNPPWALLVFAWPLVLSIGLLFIPLYSIWKLTEYLTLGILYFFRKENR